MRRIGKGLALPEEIEAFRAVHPTWYDDLRQTTAIHMQGLARKGKLPGAMRLSEIETNLDLAGQIDPSLGNQVAQIYQTHMAIKAELAKEAMAAPAGGKNTASQRAQLNTRYSL